MTLGDLIKALAALPAEAPVVLRGEDSPGDHGEGFVDGCVPTTLDSYRGYYDQLALGFTSNLDAACTVADLLRGCQDADGTVFHGWKGGEYRMDLSTAVWVDNRGDYNSRGIFGVEHSHGQVRIYTAVIPFEYQ